MPLENFYKESDQAARHGRFILGLVFVLVALYFVSVYFFYKTAVPEDSSEYQPEMPTAADRLRNVDALCTNLPRPEKFFFLGRGEPIFYSQATAIVYRYKSERDFEELMPVFTLWFGENGWKSAEDNQSFKKGTQRISILYTNDYDGKYYDFYCFEEKSSPSGISFGIYD
jgi:hypothetical protein